MPPPDSSADRDPLDRLAEEFVDRYRRGERPSLTEYAGRYPDLAAQIRDLFPALVEMEQLKPAAGEHTGAFPPAAASTDPVRVGEFRILRRVGRGGMGVVYEAVQESLGRHVALKLLPADAPMDAKRLERFRREAKAAAGLHHTNIVPVFGTGEADGRHFYAMQFISGHPLDAVIDEVRRLNQKAAVLPPARRGASEVARAMVTGTFAGPPPVDSAAALAPTRPDSSLARVPAPAPPAVAPAPPSGFSGSASESGRPYWETVARAGAEVADALAYAHSQGVLHRDIKPANLLLDLRGTVWVTDFGLAKATDADDLTQAGDIVGTLRYMAPERFDGAGDARADTYALGLTLYELLTLRPAFEAENRAKLVEQALAANPPRPRAHNPAIPRDLETVVLKAIARDPALRYQTAAELAADLRRYVEDRPILARRASNAERAWRWCRRNPAVASLMAAVLLVFATGAAVSAYFAHEARGNAAAAGQRAEDAIGARKDAVAARHTAWLREAEALVGEAHGIRYSRREGQRFAALAALKKAADIGRELKLPPEWFDRLRNEAAAALALPDIHVTRQWEGYPVGTNHLAVAADHSVYARADKQGAISVRRMSDDAELFATAGDGRTSVSCWLSADGRHLCASHSDAASNNIEVVVWHLRPEGAVELFRVPEVHWVAFMDRADGRRVVFVRMDGSLNIYDLSDGKRLAAFPGEGITTRAGALVHPTEPLVAMWSYQQGGVVVRDLRTGAVVSRLDPPWPGGCTAGWHPCGRYLLVGQADQGPTRVYSFDPANGRTEYRWQIDCNHGCTGYAFNVAGDRVCGTGWNAAASVCDFWTGQKLFQTKLPHRGAFALDPTGGRLALSSVAEHPTRVGVWSVADGHEYRSIVPTSDFGRNRSDGFAVHPGGRLVAQGTHDGVVLYDLETGRELASIRTPSRPPFHSISPHFDGAGSLYTNGFGGCFRWPVRPDLADAGRLVVGPPEVLPFHPGDRAVAASRDGRVVAQCMYAGYGMQEYPGGWITHPDHPRPRLVLGGHSMFGASVSPDGRWVAFVVFGFVAVFDAATAREIARFPNEGTCQFSGDGRLLFVGAATSRAVAVGTWETVAELGAGGVQDCTHDGKYAILSLLAGIYRLVDVASGRELVRLEDPEAHSGEARFTPDGARIVVRAANGMRVWDLRRIRTELAALGLDWDAPAYAPAPAPADRFEVRIDGADSVFDPAKLIHLRIEALDRELKGTPRDAETHALRGDFLVKLNRNADAFDAYTKALELGDDSPTTRYQRARTAFRLRRWPVTTEDATAVLAKEPGHSRARYLRTQALRLSGHHAEAIADYTEVLRQFPKDGVVYAYRADCYEATGDRAKADADRELAIQFEPDSPMMLNNLAWKLVARPGERRDPERGLQLVKKAVKKDAGNPTYLNTLGVAEYRCRMYAEAVATLDRSLAAGKGESDAFDLYFLAMCHAKLADAKKAKECFARAAAWAEKQVKTLSAEHVAELADFRAEAAEVLGVLAPPPRPVAPAAP